MTRERLFAFVCVLAIAIYVTATLDVSARQPPSPAGAGNASPGQGRGGGRRGPQVDQAAFDRGEQVLVQHCGFCHGANARGGSSGPDLLRSELVLNDENGKQLGDFLAQGRPDKGMPAVRLSEPQVSDLATYLHAQIAAAANRGSYKILDILTGDPKAGEAYFNGAGGCGTCHSPAGNLAGIGAKYDPVTLQQRIIMPRGRGGPGGGDGRGGRGGGGGRGGPGSGGAVVTVTLPSGESYTGAMLRLTDFDVMLRDDSGQTRSWLRNGESPKVVVTDPLQGHIDLLNKWTDTDMRNVTAYLAGLK